MPAGANSSGLQRIEWADGQMPVLRSVRSRFAAEKPLDGLAVAACLHVTAETACLVHTLRAGGASVTLASANPLTVQVEVAEEIGDVRTKYPESIAELVEASPDITVDDGADLITYAHAVGHELLGGTEETTTGLLRLRSMELTCPVIAVNEAYSERRFNDHYGTGQSALDGILRATGILLAGRTVVVLGFGTTGRGIAERARGAGAQVIVCEVDPLRALEARMEGFEVLPALRAAERGEVFVTVTGSRSVLRAEHFEAMRDGAVLANAGHFDVEIDLPELQDWAQSTETVLPLVQTFTRHGRRLHLLASGRVVNLAAGQGHPAEVMDLSFALQALAVERLAKGDMTPGIHAVPEAIDREVAALKLAALGVEIDELTEDQQAYRRHWS